jgi:hypothetical protein
VTSTDRIDPVANKTTRDKTTKKAPTNIPYTSVVIVVSLVSGITTFASVVAGDAFCVVVAVEVPLDEDDILSYSLIR